VIRGVRSIRGAGVFLGGQKNEVALVWHDARDRVEFDRGSHVERLTELADRSIRVSPTFFLGCIVGETIIKLATSEIGPKDDWPGPSKLKRTLLNVRTGIREGGRDRSICQLLKRSDGGSPWGVGFKYVFYL